jgi:hypothetical protein
MTDRDPKWFIGLLASLALAATYAQAYISQTQTARSADIQTSEVELP